MLEHAIPNGSNIGECLSRRPDERFRNWTSRRMSGESEQYGGERESVMEHSIQTVVLSICCLCIANESIAQQPRTLQTNKPIAADRQSMWLSPDEIRQLPMRGEAWERLRKVAFADWGKPDLSEQNHKHNTNVLAGALVAVRTGDRQLTAKVRAHIKRIPETENGGRTLALGRNLCAYVVAAGLVQLDNADVERWLRDVRNKELSSRTLISTHEDRPNNWGTHAGASRIAVAVYLGDKQDLERAARVFKGFLGDRSQYAGFRYGKDLSWQADRARPVGINPSGAVQDGRNIDGVIPDDMRRGGSFQWPPGRTGYPWAALNGTVVQAELLHRQGYDAWNWNDQAIKRAVACLDRIGWFVNGEDEEWLVHLVNVRYRTSFRTPKVARIGKNFGWTDWTHPGPADPRQD